MPDTVANLGPAPPAHPPEPSDGAQPSGAAPKVWLDYDQAALDAAYGAKAMAVHAPNQMQVVGRMVASSGSMRARIGEPQAFRYGPSAIEQLYYYPPGVPNAPIHVHVHGGAWRQRRVETILFPAEAFIRAGVGFAMFDFTAVDETGGDLVPMLEQVCAGLAWLARHARQLGGDPGRLFVSGFSSGAHLASAAMASDWTTRGFARNPFKAALLFSGVYDLRPLRLASSFSYIGFTDEIEDRMSAQRHADRIDIPTLIAVGAQETPELLRHAEAFAGALEAAGKPVQRLRCEGHNHYEMMESLGHPYSPLGRAAIAQALQPSEDA